MRCKSESLVVASDLVPPRPKKGGTAKDAKNAKSLPDEAFGTRSAIWI